MFRFYLPLNEAKLANCDELRTTRVVTSADRGACRSRKESLPLLRRRITNANRCSIHDRTWHNWPCDLLPLNGGFAHVVQAIRRQRDPQSEVEFARRRSYRVQPNLCATLKWQRLGAFIQNNPAGLIQAQSNLSAAIACDICAAFPEAQIGIVAAKRRTLQQCQRALARLCPPWLRPQIEPYGQAASQDNSRVQFLTIRDIPDRRFWESDIVLLLRAEEAARPNFIRLYDHLEQADDPCNPQPLLFGICEHIARAEEAMGDYVYGTFGFAAIDLYPNGARRDAHICWVPHRQSRLSTRAPNEAYRAGVIHNHCRNRRIAQIAREVAERRPGKIYRQVAACLPPPQQCAPRVVVLTDRLLQAIRLAERADCPLFSPADLDIAGLSSTSRRKLRVDRKLRHSQPLAIWLANYAETYTGPVPDVVIWAGGGAHPPKIPQRWLVSRAREPRPLTIIDFTDEFGPIVAHWASLRRRRYADADIFEIGQDRALGRLWRFWQTKGLSPNEVHA